MIHDCLRACIVISPFNLLLSLLLRPQLVSRSV
nr:MAG TPA: hypothetical protein [Podoviridae sp. ctK5Q1]DAP75617.1 MAG TPA: hypothetical protein [Caudoviricetes sp.]DAV72036.1 MAG TPA: hypothetical protein [Caudoviricetes sp.]DAW00528.1 MAG TPA: hypothetical protein [Caudoviricetes sp.]